MRTHLSKPLSKCFAILLVASLFVFPAPTQAAPSKWDARIYQDFSGEFVGQATVKVLSNGKLQIVVPFVSMVGNSKSIWTQLWRGTCQDRGGALISPFKKKSTPYGYIKFSLNLSTAQSRSVKTELSKGSVTISIGGNCGTFQLPGAAGKVRSNPIPFGATSRYEEWNLTFLSINDDAFSELLNANIFNDPPHPGWQYVLFYVEIMYLGKDSSSTSSVYLDVQAVGVSGRTYKNSFAYRCGVLPEPEITHIELFPGRPIQGNLFCLEIQSSDLDSLVVFLGYDDLPYNERIWWAVR